MGKKISTLFAGIGFGLAGAMLALPFAGIVHLLPFILFEPNLAVTRGDTGEPVPLLLSIAIDSAAYLPSALLLGLVAGGFHRVANSKLCTAFLGFGSLSLAAVVQPFFPVANAAEGQSLVQHQSVAVGVGIVIQCLAAGIMHAKRKLPAGVYQVAAGAISGSAGSLCAGVVLDYFFVYAAVMEALWPVLLILGLLAGPLNRIIRSNLATALLGFVSAWIGIFAPALGMTKYVSEVVTVVISAEDFAMMGVGLLFQWIVAGIVYVFRRIRNAVRRR